MTEMVSSGLMRGIPIVHRNLGTIPLSFRCDGRPHELVATLSLGPYRTPSAP